VIDGAQGPNRVLADALAAVELLLLRDPLRPIGGA
jgi:hypothetical protein